MKTLLNLLPHISIVLLLSLSACNEKQSAGTTTAFIPLEQLAEGDLVFRRGTGIMSRAVLSVDAGGEYSHIGMVVKQGDGWKVVHAVPGEPDFEGDLDRVKMEDIAVFFDGERAKSGAVLRVNADTMLVCCAARHAVELFRSSVLFDHRYNLSDTTQMYCTELIHHVLKRQGIDLVEGRLTRLNVPGFNGEYLFPSDLFRSEKLRLIYIF